MRPLRDVAFGAAFRGPADPLLVELNLKLQFSRSVFGLCHSLAVLALRRVLADRDRCGGASPSTYDCTRWFQLHVRQTSTTCTVNSSFVSASRTISSSLRAEPDTVPKRSPKTQDTRVSCSLRQIGHTTELGRP